MLIQTNKSLKSGYIYFYIIILFFPFGLLVYNYFNIQYIDEFITLFLTLYWITKKGFTKSFKRLLLVFIFYLFYSLVITKINGNIAPFYDLQQQIKPYIVLLATLSLKPQFQPWQIQIIRKIIVTTAIILFLVYLSDKEVLYIVLGHPAYAATTSLTLGLYYLYFSDYKKKDIVIVLIILLCGLLSFRSKYYGEFCLFIGVYFFLGRIKLNFKFLIYSILMLSCILYFIWDKFNYYFIQGFTEESGLARPILYKTSWNILCDYIPFGSGLGTFADEASRVFYSPIYEMYNIDNVWGLSLKDNAAFATDTFFPILAQFGFAGIFLFIIFWRDIYLKVKNIANIKFYKIGIIILGCIFIESTSDSSMLSNRGILILILLGLCCNNVGKFSTSKKLKIEKYK